MSPLLGADLPTQVDSPAHSPGPSTPFNRYKNSLTATGLKTRAGQDEIYFGKQMKFVTVVSNLNTGEPLVTQRAENDCLSMQFTY
jgi:hypothetical protein